MSPDKLDFVSTSDIAQLTIVDSLSLPNLTLGVGILILGITLVVLYFRKKRRGDL